MKILVTGGAGFIGSHLCLKLLELGFEVTSVDDLSLGQERFLAQCKKNPKFRFIKGDLLIPAFVREVMVGKNQVWHLAANSDIAAGGNKTDIDLKIGTLATYNVLEAMRLEGVKEFIFSSTSAIYGEAVTKPTGEDYGPLLPISFYGASKLACEALATAFSHNYDIKVWIFRFANIVGSHTTHGAIHDFIKKLRANPEFLEILGDGKQEKSYLHVQDCLEGMLLGYKKSKEQVNLYNLASLGVCSVDEMAGAVISSMGLKSSKRFSGGSRGWKGDVARVELDGSKLQSCGFSPRFKSSDAVRQAINDILSDSSTGIA